MSRFAFYGRVSTEDQQDPAASRGWQLSRAESLIAPHDGRIVAEYFDVGLSRSLPWQRRPEAARLLAASSLAFYIGRMGAYYADMLTRHGYGAEVAVVQAFGNQQHRVSPRNSRFDKLIAVENKILSQHGNFHRLPGLPQN